MHKPIRRIATLSAHCLALLVACIAPSPAAQTDLADYPMMVGNNAPPNYLFMLDNSSSMNNIVPESPYSEDARYSCPKSNQISAATPIYLRVVSGAPRVSFGNSGANLACTHTAPCAFGNQDKQVCFVEDQHYSNVRLLVDANGMNYEPGRYSGRYLNWYFRDGTGGWGDYKPGTRTRLAVAKEALKEAVEAIPASSTGGSVRTGLATFNGGNGGRLVRPVEALDLTLFKASVDGISAASGTEAGPLSETLADIGQYFSLGYTGALTLRSGASVSVGEFFRQEGEVPHGLLDRRGAAPVQSGYWCQRSHAFLMTDGLSSEDRALGNNPINTYLCDYDGDSDGDAKCATSNYDTKSKDATHLYGTNGSDYLDDVAQALFETDLRPDIAHPRGEKKSNNVLTHTIAFGDAFTDPLKDPRKDPLLVEAATQGGGFTAKAGSQSDLTAAFTAAVNTAAAQDSAAAAVAVTSQRIAANTIGYESVYQSGYWTGDLVAHSLDLSTGLPIGKPLWSAQKKLDALASPATSRKIVSLKGSGGEAFTADNFADPAIGLTAGVINFLRGDDSNEGAGIDRFRIRQHLLGDIINAEPVYGSFASGPVVFQAANDGMLHAFGGGDDLNNDGGDELWAYVPKMLHGSLARLAERNYAHRYFVDATPALTQVNSTGFTGMILVGGLGKGGKGYYALDVTDPRPATQDVAAAMVKWETVPSATGSGFSFGTPLIVRTPNDGWLVLVTSGYNNADGKGYVWALDPADGRVVRTIAAGAGSSTAPAGLTHLSRLSIAAADDVAYYVYGGDLLGNVWRFDLSTWTAVKIAELRDGSGAPQPVTSAPAVGQVAGDANKFFVYVGTGQYLGETDVPGTGQNAHATQIQSMYGIIDDVGVSAPTLPNIRGSNGNRCDNGGDGAFVCQGTASLTATTVTLTTNPLQAGVHRGWYWDIPMQYGRVNTNPALDPSGVLVFTVNVPVREICGKGGSSWLMMIDAGMGGAIAKSSTSSEVYTSGQFIGDVLSSRPVIVVTSKGKFVLTRTTGATTKSNLLPNRPGGGGGASKGARVIYWRPLM
ncbi:PilC/PilY family type IV pilus protein [Aromatoleum evansii]|uniref:PilC/PilY family type IV pilus protein n=1 Tax=Aromatoleum evansii TaxID=59406 RepID=A0ABZ1ALP7_AROEV|nr:PilC/PilY family type IV pilus protein [Aromatoleum evansii]